MLRKKPFPLRSGARMRNLCLALAVTIALGIASRLWSSGWRPYDKSLGDVLDAVAAYLAIALVLPRRPGGIVLAVAGSPGSCKSFESSAIANHRPRCSRVSTGPRTGPGQGVISIVNRGAYCGFAHPVRRT